MNRSQSGGKGRKEERKKGKATYVPERERERGREKNSVSDHAK